MNKFTTHIARLTLSACIMLYASHALAEPLQEKINPGSMNWGTGDISATGIGVPPQRYAQSPARARAMAIRAAKVDAMRNLLETMQGVRVQSQTLVKDMAVESDLIRTTIEGQVRNASMVGTPHDLGDGSVEVTMAINYRKKIAKVIVELHQQQNSQKTITKPTNIMPSDTNGSLTTGLIIDAIGKGLKTALAPRILDEDGNIIYSGSMVTEDKQNDIVAYDTSVSDAAKLDRIGTHPLTLKALKVIDKTDVVISNHDAAKIGAAAGMQNTLRHARVALAL